MSLTLAGWSPTGIAAAILIAAGIVLLVAWVLRRGVHERELDGMDPGPAIAGTATTSSTSPVRSGAHADGSRTLGLLGATLLVVGLGLGLVSAAGDWGTAATSSGGLGEAPAEDCAQTWSGCPQTTPPAP